jgi:hypothetical protein
MDFEPEDPTYQNASTRGPRGLSANTFRSHSDFEKGVSASCPSFGNEPLSEEGLTA